MHRTFDPEFRGLVGLPDFQILMRGPHHRSAT
jgi:hypothetical protein